MKQANDLRTEIIEISEWLSSKSHSASDNTKQLIFTLLWAYREIKERNEILTKILVESAARGLCLDTKEKSKDEDNAAQ